MSEKNAEISARVAELIEFLHETPNSFAKALGYNRAQTIYDILSGKSAPSYDFFSKVSSAEISANINIKWLLTGRGEMLADGAPSVSAAPQDAPPAQPPSAFINDLLATIREQATEIGRLQEHIRQQERDLERLAADARTSDIAGAG